MPLPLLEVRLTGVPRCADDNQTYSQDFTVTGGRPPYTFTQPDGATETTEGEATVREIASGQSMRLIVTDSFEEACAAEVEIPAHTCTVDEPDCNLPCDGIATRQSYPLWVQTPFDESHDYLEFMLRVERLILTTDAGIQFGLTASELTQLNESIRDAIGRSGNLDESTYPDTMRRVVEVISASIDILNGRVQLENGEPALQIAMESDSFDRLVMEFFACNSFEIDIDIDYFEAQRSSETQLRYRRRLVYSEAGVQPDSENNPFPPFDRFEIDRCDAQAEPNPLCRGEVNTEIRQRGEGTQRTFILADNQGEHPVWFEFPLGQPGFSLQPVSTVQYPGNGIETLATALMVDAETGCFTIVTSQVNT
jgi:hypothetical protein